MINRAPEFIEFRRHVNELIAAGDLVNPEDALIYAIKECQDREISYRIQTTKKTSVVDHKHIDEYCAAKIFFRTESLDVSDFKYLLASTSLQDKIKLLETLNPIIGKSYRPIDGESKYQIKLLINSLLSSERDCQAAHLALVGGPGITITLSNVYDDENDGAKACERLMEHITRSHEMFNFDAYVTCLNEAIKLRLGGDTDDLRHWLKVETIASHNGALVYEDPVRQYEMVKKLLEVIDSITTQDVGKLTKARQLELAPFVERLEARLLIHLKSLSQTLDKGVTPALMMFGNRNTKDGGKKMPQKIVSLFRLLIKSGIHQEATKEVCTKVVVKLCNGSVKTMQPSEVANIINSVKDSVDWPQAVSGMNTKGRALLLSSFSDTRYYRDLVSRDERAMAFRGDLEM